MIENLEKYLRNKQQRFTLNEAAVATGLSVDETRSALDELIRKYIARIQVTENGDLIYDFGKPLRRWGEKTAAEKWQSFLDWCWKVFKVVFKAWITVTLVAYFVIFVVILLVLLFANSSDKSGKRGSVNLSGLSHIFFAIFRWNTATGTTLYRTDNRGYRYREYQPIQSTLKRNKKSFIAAVYDFVFGPPRVEPDPLNNQKEAAAFLNKEKGVVVMAELEALAGWTNQQAEQFFTECLVRFEGEAKVNENGVVYGEFDNIIRGIGKADENQIVYYWDEYEPEYELNGNSKTQNMWIFLMNGFNLLFSSLVVSGKLAGLAGLASQGDASMLAGSLIGAILSGKLLLGWIPLIFSIVFFLVPLLRYFQIQKARQKRHHHNIRKRFYKIIFQTRAQPQTLEAVHYAINENASEETLSKEITKTMLEELVLNLKGETTVSEDGKVLYHFPRTALELSEVQKIREKRKPPDTLGEIIMDSEG